MVMPPQRFPSERDNLKNILVRPFKFGMWVYMGNATNAIVLNYKKLDHPIAGIYNIYIYVLCKHAEI